MAVEETHEANYRGGKIKFQRHTIGGHTTVYRIAFSDGRPPLVITRAVGEEIGKHWTSIPEGRFNEAEEMGLIIEDYFKRL
jgi:hypothetical protein